MKRKYPILTTFIVIVGALAIIAIIWMGLEACCSVR